MIIIIIATFPQRAAPRSGSVTVAGVWRVTRPVTAVTTARICRTNCSVHVREGERGGDAGKSPPGNFA